MATTPQTQTEKSAQPEKPKNSDSAFGWKHAIPILISTFALIISTWQFFIAQESASITAYDRGAGPVLELDKAYLANSDLRPYFYENKHLDDKDPARTKVLSLAEMSLDCYENVLSQTLEHPSRYPADQIEGDIAWVSGMLKNSEVLRDYLHSHASWYSKRLHDLAP